MGSAKTRGQVSILLGTYNGEQYLDEQIRSLLAQTYRDFVILARDDNSSDRTAEILRQWSIVAPDKIKLLSDDRGNLGLLKNFSVLMEACTSEYFAFCDQDDVWLPHKLEVMVNEVKHAEAISGNTIPVLVHSDLIIVDSNLKPIYSSLFAHRRIKVGRDARFPNLLFTNVALGCASMGNRALLVLARPIPEKFPFHDWWVALIAASCGVVHTINEPTILYRQHGQNQIGAGPRHGPSMIWDARHVLRRPKRLKSRLTRAMRVVQCQSNLVLGAAGKSMSDTNRKFLRALCMPQNPDEMAGMKLAQRTWLFLRFLVAYARTLPVALRWCY